MKREVTRRRSPTWLEVNSGVASPFHPEDRRFVVFILRLESSSLCLWPNYGRRGARGQVLDMGGELERDFES